MKKTESRVPLIVRRLLGALTLLLLVTAVVAVLYELRVPAWKAYGIPAICIAGALVVTQAPFVQVTDWQSGDAGAAQSLATAQAGAPPWPTSGWPSCCSEWPDPRRGGRSAGRCTPGRR